MTTRKAVLLIGASGAFGSRLAKGLAETTDFKIILAGRSLARAQALAADLRGEGRLIEATSLDADTILAEDVRRLGAFIVANAAGPFQAGDDRIARAALAGGAHYVDLADGRAFVAGFARLNDEAEKAGLMAVAGASSTPALSNAVLDRFLKDWRRVDFVEIVISPGNRAPRGLSVMRAILSYAGRPVRVFLDGAWTGRPGWGMLRRRRLRELGDRWVSLCETPDLDIVRERFDVRRSAIMAAGLELSILHLGLWIVSFSTRLGLVRSLEPAAAFFRRLAALFAPFGTDRGGMRVEARGLNADGRAARVVWTLVAEGGDGPFIPTLPALALMRMLADGRLNRPGASACVGLVDLAAIEAEFSRFRIKTLVESDDADPAVLFKHALKKDFALLPQALQALHSPGPWLVLEGRAVVEGAQGLLARIAAKPFGFPPSGEDIPVRVAMAAEDGREVWTRDFGGRRFRSVLSRSASNEGLDERFGPFRFDLDVRATAAGLTMTVRRWRIGGLRLPVGLAPRAEGAELVDSRGRACFDVTIALPLVGRLVRYRGWLVEAPYFSEKNDGSAARRVNDERRATSARIVE